MEEKLKQTSNELELIFKAIPDLVILVRKLDGTLRIVKLILYPNFMFN